MCRVNKCRECLWPLEAQPMMTRHFAFLYGSVFAVQEMCPKLHTIPCALIVCTMCSTVFEIYKVILSSNIHYVIKAATALITLINWKNCGCLKCTCYCWSFQCECTTFTIYAAISHYRVQVGKFECA